MAQRCTGQGFGDALNRAASGCSLLGARKGLCAVLLVYDLLRWILLFSAAPCAWERQRLWASE